MPAAPESIRVQQQSLPMFTRHELAARDEQVRQELNRKLKRQAAYEARKLTASQTAAKQYEQRMADLFDQIDDSLLDMPLGGPEVGNELNCEIDPVRAGEAVVDEVTFELTQAWSDKAVEELHETVLHYSLSLLQAKGNGTEKKEVLRWIFAPPTMEAKLTDPETHEEFWCVLPQYATPFSFEQCCRICGYSSERVMDGLVPILEEIGLGQICKEISNGHNHYPQVVQHS